jgi:flagellar biosynthesis GTPase FlhF
VNGEGCHQSQSMSEHLSRAKDAVASGMSSWRVATEHMAAAKAEGASQRRIAEEVGMSSAWVHQMLRWREDGYQDATPFGRQSKVSRRRAKAGQATDHKKEKADQSDTRRDQAQAAAARARAETAKAEAARSEAEALRAKADAAKAEADARTAKAKAEARRSRRSFRRESREQKKPIPSGPRELLVKTLGMLGSDQSGERDNVVRAAERLRTKLGLTWDQLIVPATEAEAARAA